MRTKRLSDALEWLSAEWGSPGLRLCVAVLWIVGVGTLMGFRINVTRSLPLGLYVTDSPTALQPGSIVIACLPERWGRFARERGILGPGFCPGKSRGIGKMVLAVSGDVVELRPEGIAVNGISVPNSSVVSTDRFGRPLPHHPWGVYVLRADQLWLFSPYHPRSFDSRYYGPVHRSAIRAVILPVWTDEPANRQSDANQQAHSACCMNPLPIQRKYLRRRCTPPYR